MTWSIRRLDSLAAAEPYSFAGGPFGSKLTSLDYVDNGVPVIRGNNLNRGRFLGMDDFVYVSDSKVREDLSGNLSKAGDLIFTQRGTLGQVAIVPENGVSSRYVVSQSQMKLTVDRTQADELFLYYYFSSREAVHRIKNLDSSSGVPHINLTALRALELPVPPLTEQKRIAAVLSAYDELIENNQRRIRLLERAARMLYEEWFVRLRFPGHERVHVADGVPAGWARKRLSEIASILMGQSPRSTFYNDNGDGLPFHQGVTNFGDRFPTHRTYTTSQSRVAEAGDILFSVRAPVGRINVAMDRIAIGRGIAAIRSNRNEQSFLFYALRSYFFRDDIMGVGSIFAAIAKKDLHGVMMMQPSEQISKAFVAQVGPMDDAIRSLHREVDLLTRARDLLVPRLMNGEIAV